MVRDDVRHHEPRVIVHEADEVDALMLAEQEREDVRLPHLIRPRSFESARRLLFALARRGRRRHQPGLVQHLAHLRFAHADGFEAREQIPDPPGTSLGIFALHLDDRVVRCARGLRLRPGLRLEPFHAFGLVPQVPILHGRVAEAEGLRGAVDRLSALDDLPHNPNLQLKRIGATPLRWGTPSTSIISRHLPSRPNDLVRHLGGAPLSDFHPIDPLINWRAAQ